MKGIVCFDRAKVRLWEVIERAFLLSKSFLNSILLFTLRGFEISISISDAKMETGDS